jgi:serine/threonine protein kinase
MLPGSSWSSQGWIAEAAERGVELPQLLAETANPPLPLLAAAVARELRRRIADGEEASVEEYLNRFPQLSQDPELLVDLIYAEYCARRQANRMLDPHLYYQRFPERQASLARLFCLHSLLASNEEALQWLRDHCSELPSPGQTFLDFDLLKLLGQGAFARVFLARQRSLAYRLVVVKITRGVTHEPETLARLGHPHIMPIYSLHHDEGTGLTAICMPYHAAISLAHARESLTQLPKRTSRAGEWVRAAQELTADWPPPPQTSSWPYRFPASRGFVYGTLWLMRQVADALAHAHERHILHLDLKPSNVLITREGQPLLVDFNLAWPQMTADSQQTLLVGGTLPYMAPEQIEALRGGPQSRSRVGVGSDLFGLAATFYELLTGKLPYGAPEPTESRESLLEQLLELRRQPAPPPSAHRTDVERDIDALFFACLHPDPARRPTRGDEVVEELDRYLADRVLKRVPGWHLDLRAHRFLRRHRGKLLGGTVGVLVLGASLTALYHFDSQPRGAEGWFAEGYVLLTQKRYEEAYQAFEEALRLGYPNQVAVLSFQAIARARVDKDEEALVLFNKVIELAPSYTYAYVGRALLLSGSPKVADYERALEDANTVYEHWQRSDWRGADPGQVIDLARCYALLAERRPEEAGKHLSRAVTLLRQALQLGVSVDRLQTAAREDESGAIDRILKQPEFQALLASEGRELR